MIFHSLDILNRNTDSHAGMAQSVKHLTASRKVPVIRANDTPSSLRSKSRNLCELQTAWEKNRKRLKNNTCLCKRKNERSFFQYRLLRQNKINRIIEEIMLKITILFYKPPEPNQL